MRELKFYQAILEATDQCMAKDPSVYVMGLGVTDPKGTFGTTLGLEKKYGSKRVLDMPTSENGMTGVAIGSALVGLRPVMTHQRVDFTLLALDQIVNNAAKWHYMFHGQFSVPLVIRMVIGRGWGQGPQHSQSLQAFFAHVPGLKVVMPATPYDAKGLLISSIEDDNPVIFLEHRWLHGTHGFVPEEVYRVPLGKARLACEGGEATLVATSQMTIEALHAAHILRQSGIEVEVVDLRSIRPLDRESIVNSVRKTGRLIVLDGAWPYFGVAAEIIAVVCEETVGALKVPPVRITFPDFPAPSTPFLANHYYPRIIDIVNAVRKMLQRPLQTEEDVGFGSEIPLDVPDNSFTGPF